MVLFKRLVGAILIASVMPQLTGCTLHATRLVPLTELYPEELGAAPDRSERGVIGVTTSDGSALMFDSVPTPRVLDDTVFGQVGGDRWKIPLSNTSQVWVKGPVGHARAVKPADLWSALAGPRAAESPLVGVTTRSGEEIAFDHRAAAYIAHDTVYAWARGAPTRIALADVQRLAVVREWGGGGELVAIWLGLGAVAFVLGGGFHGFGGGK
jgi:hypothetical protein